MVQRTLTASQIVRAKTRLLRMHFEAGVGHIGGNLSALEILLALYHGILGPEDAFVLSKGHAAGALYVSLWSLGRLTDDDLNTFHKDATLLSAHPPAAGLPDILFATGSLGHGASLCCGLALARKLRGVTGRVYCLTSDGEWNEGSNWEALIFARQQSLDNLTLIVDLNGLQGFGTTAEVADLGSLAGKFVEFGWDVDEIDGHDVRAITESAARTSDRPRAIVATTIKGHGVSFMENRMEWHYLPLTKELFDQAVREIEAACHGD
jgi:transketolase